MDERFANAFKHLELVEGTASESVGVHSDISKFGYFCLLTGFLCMFVSTLYSSSRAMQKQESYRKLELLCAMITGVAALFYLIMFCGSGRIDGQYYNEEGAMKTRPVFWARYIDWFISTPLILVDLLTIAGVSKDDMMFMVGVDVLMIALGFVGAFTESAAKWVFFILAMVFFGYIVMALLQNMKYNKYGTAAKHLYAKVTYLTIVIWTCYPVVWLLGEGMKAITVGLEICMYMFLDVSAKCVFAYIIINTRTALMAIHSAKHGYNQIVPTEDEETAG